MTLYTHDGPNDEWVPLAITIYPRRRVLAPGEQPPELRAGLCDHRGFLERQAQVRAARAKAARRRRFWLELYAWRRLILLCAVVAGLAAWRWHGH